MHANELSPTTTKKRETRTKIQLADLISHVGLLDAFGINLGDNLEAKDESGATKSEIKALLGALIEIKEMIAKDERKITEWIQKAIKELEKEK